MSMFRGPKERGVTCVDTQTLDSKHRLSIATTLALRVLRLCATGGSRPGERPRSNPPRQKAPPSREVACPNGKFREALPRDCRSPARPTLEEEGHPATAGR